MEVIEGNKSRDININEGAGCVEGEQANSTMGEPEIVRRARVRIDSNGISSEGLGQLDHRAAVLDESSAKDGTHEHAFRMQELDLLSSVRGRTRTVDLARRLHSQGLMRPAVVEIGLPQVALPLLLLPSGSGEEVRMLRDGAIIRALAHAVWVAL